MVVVQLTGDFADSEVDVGGIARPAGDVEGEVERVEILRADLHRPPQPRTRYLLCDVYDFSFVCRELNRLRELLPFDGPAQHAVDGRSSAVLDLRANGEV